MAGFSLLHKNINNNNNNLNVVNIKLTIATVINQNVKQDIINYQKCSKIIFKFAVLMSNIHLLYKSTSSNLSITNIIYTQSLLYLCGVIENVGILKKFKKKKMIFCRAA